MRFEFDGATFDVSDEGSGPAIVLVHGFPLNKSVWDAQAAALANRARVVRFDLRGCGGSSVTGGPYLMEALAADLSDVLDAAGIERATIVGHSLGGYVAFAFFRLFAERCSGLGLIATRAVADDAATANARNELADRADREGIAPVRDFYLPKYFAPEFYASHPDLVDRARAVVEATDPRGAAAMLRGMALRVASYDLFEEIAVPVRVVAGAKDAVGPLALSEFIASGIPHAKLDVIDCGHFPLFEAPERLNASLGELLDDVASGA